LNVDEDEDVDVNVDVEEARDHGAKADGTKKNDTKANDAKATDDDARKQAQERQYLEWRIFGDYFSTAMTLCAELDELWALTRQFPGNPLSHRFPYDKVQPPR